MKRTVIIVGCLALAMVAGVAIGVNPSVFRTPAVAETLPAPVAVAAGPAISLLDVLNARSPGKRGRVHLLTKVKASPLSMVRTRASDGGEVLSPEESFESAFDGSETVGEIGPVAIDFSEIVEAAPTIPDGSSASFNPVSPVVPLNPVIPPVMAIPPATAVPEPATWAMLLLGFGGIAMLLRRRKQTPHAAIA